MKTDAMCRAGGKNTEDNVLDGSRSAMWLFRAISYAEQVHATSHSKALGNLGKTADNLVAAIGGETYEVEEMYPAFRAVAELQEDKDAEVGDAYICEVCGWTVEGEPPDRCPLCGAKRDKFQLVT